MHLCILDNDTNRQIRKHGNIKDMKKIQDEKKTEIVKLQFSLTDKQSGNSGNLGFYP